jgi:hypothetical protein
MTAPRAREKNSIVPVMSARAPAVFRLMAAAATAVRYIMTIA